MGSVLRLVSDTLPLPHIMRYSKCVLSSRVECDESFEERGLEELNSLLNDGKGIRALRNVLFRANPRNPEDDDLLIVML
ncbi:MAG: hypothetical protein QXY89_02615 [Zestosphaera sp.]